LTNDSICATIYSNLKHGMDPISMSETPKNNPIIIISLIVVELLSIVEELMVVGRQSG
jgi:hypothetical protein